MFTDAPRGWLPLLSAAVCAGAASAYIAWVLTRRGDDEHTRTHTLSHTPAHTHTHSDAHTPEPHARRPLARRIILVRHGESAANVDRTVHARVPDHLVPLTPRGRDQCTRTGTHLRAILGGSPVMFVVSPYERTRQTYRCIRAELEKGGCRVLQVREEPRVREQEFGNFQDAALQQSLEEERKQYGRFFYRMPQGESGADVYDRVSSYFDTMFRTFKHSSFDPETNVIIVTHGLTLRVFLMRFFHWSVELFERTTNPQNAGFVVMRLCQDPVTGTQRYRLDGESARVIGLDLAECDAAAAKIEEHDREAVGTDDIHIPAVAENFNRPLDAALSARIGSPQADAESKDADGRHRSALVDIALQRDVWHSPASATRLRDLPPGAAATEVAVPSAAALDCDGSAPV